MSRATAALRGGSQSPVEKVVGQSKWSMDAIWSKRGRYSTQILLIYMPEGSRTIQGRSQKRIVLVRLGDIRQTVIIGLLDYTAILQGINPMLYLSYAPCVALTLSADPVGQVAVPAWSERRRETET